MRRLLVFLSALLGVLALGAGTVRAAGENSLESSNPAAGETVALAPTQIQLKFVNPIGGATAVAQMGLVLSCEDKIVNLGPPALGSDGLTVSAALTQVLPNGKCTVNWSLPDTSTGSFQFTSATQPTETTPSSATDPANTIPGLPGAKEPAKAPRLGGPIGLVRWMAFFFVSAFIGGLLFVRFVWPEGVEYDITETYIRQVGVVAVVALYLQLAFMAARESGGGLFSAIVPTSWGDLMQTSEGRALFGRLIALAALVGIAWITERIYYEAFVMPTTLAIGVLFLTYGFDRFSGRAVIAGVVLSALHMALVIAWVGALAIIWRVVLFGPGDVDLVHALRMWHRFAPAVTLGIVVTGAMEAYRIDGFSYVNSGHGRVLIMKVALVGGLIWIDAGLRVFVLRGMQRARSLNDKVVLRLKRPFGVQLALSITVLATSSWLMAMRPPYVLLRDRTEKTEYAIVQDLEGEDGFHVRVSITPGNVGDNSVLVELFGPKRIQNFVIRLVPENPAYNGYTINVPITRPGGAFIAADAGFKLQAPGNWSISITGVTTIGDLPTLTGQFVIADGVTVTTVPRQGLKQTSTTLASSSTVSTSSTTTTTTIAGATNSSVVTSSSTSSTTVAGAASQ